MCPFYLYSWFFRVLVTECRCGPHCRSSEVGWHIQGVWGWKSLVGFRGRASGGLLARQRTQKLDSVCYLTSSFNTNFMRVCLDYMIYVHSGLISPEIWMTKRAVILAAVGCMQAVGCIGRGLYIVQRVPLMLTFIFTLPVFWSWP